MKRLLLSAIEALGYVLVRRQDILDNMYPADVADEDRQILDRVSSYTMTSVERQLALIQAVRHLARSGIQGCFVECGVWKGGSSMAAALTLLQEGESNRHLYLYDTFEGMTPPQAVDRTYGGYTAAGLLEKDRDKSSDVWALAGLDEVRANMATTGYPTQYIHYIKGSVEETLPAQLPPAPIALLRLDTDWYESTRHELIHLFPLLCEGGILNIDDYGHWEGARKAVDEYMAALLKRYYLHRIDYSGRLLVKY